MRDPLLPIAEHSEDINKDIGHNIKVIQERVVQQKIMKLFLSSDLHLISFIRSLINNNAKYIRIDETQQ